MHYRKFVRNSHSLSKLLLRRITQLNFTNIQREGGVCTQLIKPSYYKKAKKALSSLMISFKIAIPLFSSSIKSIEISRPKKLYHSKCDIFNIPVSIVVLPLRYHSNK